MGMVLSISEPALDMVLYGSKAGVLNNYLMRQMQSLAPAFNDFSTRIYNSIQSSYNFINDKLTQYGLMNQLEAQGIQALDNYYQDLTSFTQLQEANLTMQRWVMADPFIRELYLEQNIDGYSDTYLNTSDKYVGPKDYHYQLAMSGVPVEVGDGKTITYFYHAEEDLREGDRKLSHHDKIAIQRTWANARHIAQEMGFDFTCKSETPTKINFE